MLTVLRNPTYAKLFVAQVVALLGTGLLTVALGLLAFDIVGGDAGVVMGVAMTIKMIAYVAVSPVTTALAARLPRKPVLVGADLVRAGVAMSLPFVTEAWQIYVLIFLLQSASATFTPTFQAVIPSVLPDERDYTRALSLSRLAYDLESLISPMLAAALLTVITYNNLFVGTVIGFLASAVLVVASRFPHIEPPEPARFFDRLTRGVRSFWARPELRGLMGLNLVVATTTAMVIVNTVVLVQGDLGRTRSDVALLLAAYGGGSMVVALWMPRLLDTLPDRRVMLTGGIALPILLAASAGVIGAEAVATQWVALLVLWFLLGAATSTILTPSARLLRRNSHEGNRPAVFAAQFSLSHACFLVTYPLAGTLGAAIGLPAVALVLVAVGVVGAVLALVTWRSDVPVAVGR
ncbi:MFS transporter [Georgenia sp. Z1344]|uniref:MFS transporter n=1 Tax=Georgenia sp. Z1344 TaxID=3416706 RepID=UPI003CE713A5